MSHRYVHPEYNSSFNSSGNISTNSSNSSLQSAPSSSSNLNLYSISSQPSNPTLETSIFPWENSTVLNSPTVKNANTQQTYSLPPYFRSISTCIPISKEVQTNAGVPLGIIVTPGLITNAPVINKSDSIVYRCSKCQGYLSPYTKVNLNDGKSYTCPLCGQMNTISVTPSNPRPLEPQYHPEYSNPVYDIIAPKTYVMLPKFVPVFSILVDVSIPAYTCGFTSQFLTSIKTILPSINQNICVNLITFADKVTTFDIINQREIIVPDSNDLVVPKITPARLQDNMNNLIEIIDELISRQPSPTAVGNCLPTALLLCTKLMQGYSGNAFIGVVNIPTLGPYPLHPRDPNQDELSMLKLPSDGSGKFFRDVAFHFSHAYASYHIFAISHNMSPQNQSAGKIDMPVIGVPSGLTGGRCHYYGQATSESLARLHVDLFNELTTNYFYNASLRMRCTAGVKISKLHGNFLVQNKDLINFPVLMPESAISIELTVESELKNVSECLFQLALLWTSLEGVRMIRIFNFSLPVVSDVKTIRSSIDEGALATFFAKRVVHSVLSSGKESAMKLIHRDMFNIISHSISVRSMFHLSHAISLSQLISVPCDFGVDGRMCVSVFTRAANVVEMMLYLYPRMFALDSTIVDSVYNKYAGISPNFLGPLPLAAESFGYGSVFLFHTNTKIYIWVSKAADPSFLNGVFGCSSIQDLPTEIPSDIQTPENQKIQLLLNECWKLSGKYIPNEVIPQEDPREYVISRFLVDSTPNNDLKAWANLMRTAPVQQPH